jgi:hypothetical protein
MEPDHAKDILKALADGRDPPTRQPTIDAQRLQPAEFFLGLFLRLEDRPAGGQ